MNTVINALGGTIGSYSGPTGIYVNYVALGSADISSYLGSGSGGYDSTYDAICFWDYSSVAASDTANVLNTWYNNNKGVVLGIYAD